MLKAPSAALYAAKRLVTEGLDLTLEDALALERRVGKTLA
jgi:hypothetical protein